MAPRTALTPEQRIAGQKDHIRRLEARVAHLDRANKELRLDLANALEVIRRMKGGAE